MRDTFPIILELIIGLWKIISKHFRFKACPDMEVLEAGFMGRIK